MLPNNFCPAGTYELFRLGSKRDGGYLVEGQSFYASKKLCSFGIGLNWAFEKDFYKKNKVTIEAYDPETSLTKMLIATARNIWRNPHRIHHILYLLFDYIVFYQLTVQHHKLFVGAEKTGYRNLKQIIGNDDDHIFLKIDIEGAEYDILDELILYASKLESLIIEFHDVHIHKDRIEKFIDALGLYVAHIHPNNFAPILQNGITPILEMTFTKYKPTNKTPPTLPHPLDAPNQKNAPDIKLVFDK